MAKRITIADLTKNLAAKAKGSMKDLSLKSGEKREIFVLNVADIDFNPNNPRSDGDIDQDYINRLGEDIKRRGLKNAIRVITHPQKSSRYLLLDGEMRLRAHQTAELKTVEAVIETVLDEDEEDEETLLGNLYRLNLNLVDAAAAAQRLKERHGYTDDQLVGAMGLGSRTSVTEFLSINTLPDTIRDEYRTLPIENKKGISKSLLVQLTRVEQKAQDSTWEDVKVGKLTVRDVKAVKQTKTKKRPEQRSAKRRVLDTAKTLQRHLESADSEDAKFDAAYVSELEPYIETITDLYTKLKSNK